MAVKMVFALNSVERAKIKSILAKQALSQAELADRIGMHGGELSRLLNGRRGLNGVIARKLYDALGKEDTLGFLIDEHFRGVQLPQEHLWDELYETHSFNLMTVYHRVPADIKGQIIGDLEKLVEKYQKQGGT